MAIALNFRRPRARPLAGIRPGVRAGAAAFVAERDRWALWLPAALATGIGIYFALPFEPSPLIGAALGGAGLLLATAAILSTELGLKALFAFAAAVLIGFGAVKLREESVAAPVLSHRVGPAQMEGRVEFAQTHGKGMRAVIAPEFIARYRYGALPTHIRVSFRNDGGVLVPGAEIAFKVVLMPPPAPASPGDYDFGRAAFFEGLGVLS